LLPCAMYFSISILCSAAIPAAGAADCAAATWILLSLRLLLLPGRPLLPLQTWTPASRAYGDTASRWPAAASPALSQRSRSSAQPASTTQQRTFAE
jgi:hypothetical protein